MAQTARPYKLVPAEVPPRRGRGAGVYAAVVADFVATEREKLTVRETEAFNHILRTQVDFKLMEQD